MQSITFDQAEAIGVVQSVDTGTAVVQVTEPNQLSMLQVNHMVVIQASAPGQLLIGMVSKIMRRFAQVPGWTGDEDAAAADIVKVTLVGTLITGEGGAPRYSSALWSRCPPSTPCAAAWPTSS